MNIINTGISQPPGYMLSWRKRDMKKSDIVKAIISLREGIRPTEKRVYDTIASALTYSSVSLEAWNEWVDPDLAHGIIKHVSSVRGQLSQHALIQDIDIILKRKSQSQIHAG